MKKTTILFGGDLIVNQIKTQYLFDNDIIKLFQTSDYSLVNLEGPIISLNNPDRYKIPKVGPHLLNSLKVMEYLNLLKINHLGGANNHIFDYGIKGLTSTKKYLDQKNIKYNGFGESKKQASKFIRFGKSNLGYLSVTEEEFGISDNNSPGAYSMYNNNICNQIRTLSQKNVVIIYAHGGCELVPFTSKYIQRRYRMFIECGAKLVIGHHPHVVHGYEKYKDGYIYYSLGNFLNSLSSKYKALLIKVEWKKNTIEKITPIFFKVTKGKVSIDKDQTLENILRKISNIQKNPFLFEPFYQEQSLYLYNHHYHKYFTNLFTHKDKCKKIKEQLLILHLLRNNSHNEFIKTALKLSTGQIKCLTNIKTRFKFNYLKKII